MSLLQEREAATPGWRWLMYRTWRCFNVGYEDSGMPSNVTGHRYRVTKVVPMRIDPKQRRLV